MESGLLFINGGVSYKVYQLLHGKFTYIFNTSNMKIIISPGLFNFMAISTNLFP
jgi:hypothetical protein